MTTKNAKFNFRKIIKNGKVVSTKESLREITPISWNKDVLNGNKKVVITEGGKDICAK